MTEQAAYRLGNLDGIEKGKRTALKGMMEVEIIYHTFTTGASLIIDSLYTINMPQSTPFYEDFLHMKERSSHHFLLIPSPKREAIGELD